MTRIDGTSRIVLLLWAMIGAVLVAKGWQQIVSLSGWDPDDQLRLVQLRDFMGGQSWFDTTQYRLNAPDGSPMHWSRLIELPLAFFVLIFRPLFGQPVAEMISGTVVPLLLLGWIMVMLARIASRIESQEAGIVSAIIAAFASPLLMQLRPMRIDHHGWQIAMAVLSLSTLFWPGNRKPAIVLGAALAVWLHISLEGAPMAVAFFVYLGWRWIADVAEGKRLGWTIGSFALASLLLFLATQPDTIFAKSYCDTISPPHIWGIGLATAIMLPAIYILPNSRSLRIVATIVAAGGALAVLFVLAPMCATGAFGSLDPLIREYWYVNVREGLPIWHQDVRVALALSAGSLVGVISWLTLLRMAKPDQRMVLYTLGFFAIYGALLSLLVYRTVAVATAFAIPLTAALIARLFARYRQASTPTQRIALVVTMLFLLIPGAIVSSALTAVPTAKALSTEKTDTAKMACESSESIVLLNGLPRASLLAPFDMGPNILAQTHHSVLASSHHRNVAGMRDHIRIFSLNPDNARQILAQRKISYIVLCPGESEMRLYAKKDPSGLWGMIAKGAPPAWLEPLPDMGEGIKVWRVR